MNEQVRLLNQKWWYRLLKVIYILLLMFAAFIAIVTVFSGYPVTGVVILSVALVLLEVIKRSFYYVVLGSPFPDTHNIATIVNFFHDAKKAIIPQSQNSDPNASNRRNVIPTTSIADNASTLTQEYFVLGKKHVVQILFKDWRVSKSVFTAYWLLTSSTILSLIAIGFILYFMQVDRIVIMSLYLFATLLGILLLAWGVWIMTFGRGRDTGLGWVICLPLFAFFWIFPFFFIDGTKGENRHGKVPITLTGRQTWTLGSICMGLIILSIVIISFASNFPKADQRSIRENTVTSMGVTTNTNTGFRPLAIQKSSITPTSNFQEKYPEQSTSVSLTEAYDKNGLQFKYPSSLKVEEIDGVAYWGYNAEMNVGKPKEGITVSTIRIKDMVDKCASILSERVDDKELQESISKNTQYLTDLHKNGLRSPFEGSNYDSMESYTCNSAGSNHVGLNLPLPQYKGAIFHKLISQSSETACTLNTQVLIAKGKDEFYQINFNYDFGNFSNDCKGYWLNENSPFADATNVEWSGYIYPLLRDNGFLVSGKFKNLSDNKKLVDDIIETISVK